MRGRLGYGRYDDGHIGCPRAKSDMTPCVARDGHLAGEVSAGGQEAVCVGCSANTFDLLKEAVEELSRISPEQPVQIESGRDAGKF